MRRCTPGIGEAIQGIDPVMSTTRSFNSANKSTEGTKGFKAGRR